MSNKDKEKHRNRLSNQKHLTFNLETEIEN